jgi:hypothetical protein
VANAIGSVIDPFAVTRRKIGTIATTLSDVSIPAVGVFREFKSLREV